MDIFAAYATNETKEVEGVWHDIGDSSFLIARSGNSKYGKLLSKEFEKNRKLLERKDDAADKLSETIMVNVLSKTVLLGWKNVQFKGQTMDYNEDNAKTMLAIKDFRKQIMQLAEDFEAYKVAQEAEQVGNS